MVVYDVPAGAVECGVWGVKIRGHGVGGDEGGGERATTPSLSGNLDAVITEGTALHHQNNQGAYCVKRSMSLGMRIALPFKMMFRTWWDSTFLDPGS